MAQKHLRHGRGPGPGERSSDRGAGPGPLRCRRTCPGRPRRVRRAPTPSPWSAGTRASRDSSSRPPSWPASPPPGSTCCCSACCPTPGVAYLTGALGADLGVMLSASHNPMPDNGIKFLARGGRQARRRRRGRDRGAGSGETWDRPIGGDVGRVSTYDAAVDEYAAHLARTIDRPLDGLRGRPRLRRGRGVRRGAAGAARRPAPTVIAIHAEPDGLNINDGCGSTHLGPLQAAVLEHGADAGFALDGDADRCLAVDHEGNVVDGDQILAVLALGMAAQRPARQGHRRGHRDEQPRLRAGDAGRRRRGAPDQGRRPLRARGDAGLRLLARRRAVRPRDHERVRHHRRRHPHRAARAGADGRRPARACSSWPPW